MGDSRHKGVSRKGTPPRVISQACKHEAIQLVLTSGKSMTLIAQDLGVCRFRPVTLGA